MQKHITLPALLFSFFLAAVSTAQVAPQWMHFTGSDGVLNTLLDGDYLWVSSNSGLNKINRLTGARTLYNSVNTPDFGGHDSHSLSIDGGGHLWAMSQTHGLMHFDGNTWEIIRQLPDGGNMDDGYEVVGLSQPGSAVYAARTFGPEGPKLIKVVSGNQQFIPLPPGYDISPGCLARDATDRVWVLLDSTGNLNSTRLARHNGTDWEIFYNAPLNALNFLSDLQLDALGNVYVLQNGPIVKYDGNAWSQIPIPVNVWNYYGIYDPLFVDNQNNLWLSGSYENPDRYFHYDGTTWTTIMGASIGLDGDDVTNIRVDAEGVHWISYANDYITFLYRHDGQSPPEKIDLSSDNNGLTGGYISALDISPSQAKWFGSYNNLTHFDGQQWKNIPIAPISPDSVLSPYNLTTTASGRVHFSELWGKQIYTHDGVALSSIPVPLATNGNINSVHDLELDQNDRLWVATNDGFYYLENGVFTPVILFYQEDWGGTFEERIHYVTVDADNNVWALGHTLHQLPNGASQWIDYDINSSPLTYYADIFAGRDGQIWIEDDFEGFFVFDGTALVPQPILAFPQADDSQNRLWGARFGLGFESGGLYRYEGLSETYFDVFNSGLPSNRINSVKIDANDNVWIVTPFGVTVFNENGITSLGGHYVEISGSVYSDANQNQIFDAGDYGLLNQKVRLLPNNVTTFTNAFGQYRFYAAPGDYVAQLQPIPNWSLSTDSMEYHIALDSTGATGFDFGIKPDVTTYTTDVSFTGGLARCSRDVAYWLTVRNTGTQPFTGEVRLLPDPQTTFQSANPTPNATVNDTLVWPVTNLPPFASEQIFMVFQMPNFSATGDTIHFSATAYSLINNVLVQNSRYILEQVVLCSFDPNDKTAFPTGAHLGTHSLLADALDYVIRFQNTGNDTAFNVRITDRLAVDLDLNTFEIIDASHPVRTELSTDGLATFFFDNILLPDSATNEVASQGFVRYRIRAKADASEPLIIHNTALIYFDFNPPIFTNVTENVLVSILVTTQHPAEKPILRLSPNPSAGLLTIDLDSADIQNALLRILDARGQEIFRQTGLNTSRHSFRLDNIPSGTYQVHLQTAGQVLIGKWIKI